MCACAGLLLLAFLGFSYLTIRVTSCIFISASMLPSITNNGRDKALCEHIISKRVSFPPPVSEKNHLSSNTGYTILTEKEKVVGLDPTAEAQKKKTHYKNTLHRL